MFVWGIDTNRLNYALNKFDFYATNFRMVGNALAFQLGCDSHNRYAKKSRFRSRLPYPCYHGYREFMSELFLQGATKIRTKMGVWHNLGELNQDLERIAYTNLGSLVEPRYYIYCCNCDDGVGTVIRGIPRAIVHTPVLDKKRFIVEDPEGNLTVKL